MAAVKPVSSDLLHVTPWQGLFALSTCVIMQKFTSKTVAEFSTTCSQVAPPAGQGAAAIAAASAASQNRARSVSVAAETPEGHWEVVHQQNPQFYR